eukprot:1305696-Rhodomonas_salina.1
MEETSPEDDLVCQVPSEVLDTEQARTPLAEVSHSTFVSARWRCAVRKGQLANAAWDVDVLVCRWTLSSATGDVQGRS